MFGWRRRSEGFEWQEYVRTTVLVRRADRQRRLDEARMAALAKVQEAKDKGIEAGKAGLDAAAESAARAAKATGRTLGEMAVAALYALGDILRGCVDVVIKIVTPYLPEKREVEVKTEKPVHQRFQSQRERHQKLEQAGVGAATPEKARAPRPMPDIGPNGRKAIKYAMQAAAALAVILIAGRMLQSGEPGGLETGSVATRSAAIVAEPLELAGRAQALTGDALKINGHIVRLAGVAAPEDNQPCLNSRGRRWSCSASARKALDRLVRGRNVSCEPSGADPSGFSRAICKADGVDLARALVLDGDVFAETGIFAAYASDEAAAQEAKAGVWQGEHVRPDEWRTRVWEEAKRTAPDGCPIRGIVRSGEQYYAMPWSSEYSGSRFRSGKGERWFCSEQEARDAGFKPSLSS